MKNYRLDGEHRIPVKDEIEHVPYDFCECDPFLAVWDSRVVWMHNPADCRDVVDQAERINKLVGWNMYLEQQKVLSKNRMQYFPFEPEKIDWPPSAHR